MRVNGKRLLKKKIPKDNELGKKAELEKDVTIAVFVVGDIKEEENFLSISQRWNPLLTKQERYNFLTMQTRQNQKRQLLKKIFFSACG